MNFPRPKGKITPVRLPILMYHKIRPTAADPWTVSLTEADRQWAHLRAAGFTPITCRQLAEYLAGQGMLPSRCVLLTFDDAYADFPRYALPSLQRHGLRATVFLPVKFLGAENVWDGGGERLMTVEQCAQAPPESVEFGLHSFAHGNYSRMTLAQIAADLDQCLAGLRATGVPFCPAIAYPYGRAPLRSLRRWSFFSLLRSRGIELGLRIGNRLNRLPAQRYSLTRVDVRRELTFERFCAKLES